MIMKNRGKGCPIKENMSANSNLPEKSMTYELDNMHSMGNVMLPSAFDGMGQQQYELHKQMAKNTKMFK